MADNALEHPGFPEPHQCGGRLNVVRIEGSTLHLKCDKCQAEGERAIPESSSSTSTAPRKAKA